ncbi:MAG: crossover junction endodeoxyribonuclease RuvC [Bacillota bacterium]
MLILGLDPGTSITGYGMVSQRQYQLSVQKYGVIRTASSDAVGTRLVSIHREVSSLIEEYRPDAVAVEKLFFNKNVQTAMSVGQARGVILLSAAQSDLPLLEYTPSAVKMAVTGHGSAPKRQVQAMVQSVLAMEEVPTPDDAADALAVAICGLRHWEWDRRVEARS